MVYSFWLWHLEGSRRASWVWAAKLRQRNRIFFGILLSLSRCCDFLCCWDDLYLRLITFLPFLEDRPWSLYHSSKQISELGWVWRWLRCCNWSEDGWFCWTAFHFYPRTWTKDKRKYTLDSEEVFVAQSAFRNHDYFYLLLVTPSWFLCLKAVWYCELLSMVGRRRVLLSFFLKFCSYF